MLCFFKWVTMIVVERKGQYRLPGSVRVFMDSSYIGGDRDKNLGFQLPTICYNNRYLTNSFFG